jgi:hypothetical protein
VRHGISLWIDLPLDIVARDVTGYQSQVPSGSNPEVVIPYFYKYSYICLQTSNCSKSKP